MWPKNKFYCKNYHFRTSYQTQPGVRSLLILCNKTPTSKVSPKKIMLHAINTQKNSDNPRAYKSQININLTLKARLTLNNHIKASKISYSTFNPKLVEPQVQNLAVLKNC